MNLAFRKRSRPGLLVLGKWLNLTTELRERTEYCSVTSVCSVVNSRFDLPPERLLEWVRGVPEVAISHRDRRGSIQV